MKNKKIFNASVLSLATIGLGVLYSSQIKEESAVEAINVKSVEVVSPTISTISSYKKYNGIIKGIKEDKLYPQVPSKALQVNVKKGDFVEKNQVLIVYDSSFLDEQIKIYEKSYNDILNRMTNSESDIDKYKEELSMVKNTYDSILKNKEEFTIRAPYDGVISELNAIEGEMSNLFISPIKISDTSSMIFDVRVAKADALKMKKDDIFEIKTFDENGNYIIEQGKVIEIDSEEDSLTRLYSVKMHINNENLKVTSSASLLIPIETEEEALVIPKDSLLKKGNKNYVYILDENNLVKKVDIEIGIENDVYVEIKNGLTESMRVVTKGKYDIEENELVSPNIKNII